MVAYKNIIFDLGGVLLNIDYTKTSNAFKELGVVDFDDLFSQSTANPLFEKLETGNISEDDFYQVMQQYASLPLTVNQIKTAWDAMLLNFRISSLSFLKTLPGKYNTFLLSNTNSIHHRAFLEILKKEMGIPTLDGYFKKSYYSHLIGMRKPHKDTYLFVLKDADILPAETLFIDDSIINIKPAQDLGIITHHLITGERIETLGL